MKQYANNKNINIIFDVDFEEKEGSNLIRKDPVQNTENKADVVQKIKDNLKYHLENEVN